MVLALRLDAAADLFALRTHTRRFSQRRPQIEMRRHTPSLLLMRFISAFRGAAACAETVEGSSRLFCSVTEFTKSPAGRRRYKTTREHFIHFRRCGRGNALGATTATGARAQYKGMSEQKTT